MTTFDDALAACTARCGEPSDVHSGRPRLAVWASGPYFLLLMDRLDGLELAVNGAGDGGRWMLHDAAPSDTSTTAVPLPDALDAAEAWLRGARSARG